jgi:hypothetical protein
MAASENMVDMSHKAEATGFRFRTQSTAVRTAVVAKK